jgi:hypothetical protein
MPARQPPQSVSVDPFHGGLQTVAVSDQSIIDVPRRSERSGDLLGVDPEIVVFKLAVLTFPGLGLVRPEAPARIRRVELGRSVEDRRQRVAAGANFRRGPATTSWRASPPAPKRRTTRD